MMADKEDLDRLTKLCEELRLALHRQREVNETLVKALEECAAGLDELAAYLRRRGDDPALAVARAARARLAIAAARKEQ